MARKFDGVDDGINFGDVVKISGSGQKITVYARVKFSTSQSSKPIVSKWDSGPYLLWIPATANKLEFIIRNGSNKTARGAQNYNDGKWHTVVGRGDGNNVLIDIDDGKDVAVGSAYTSMDSSTADLKFVIKLTYG